MNGRVDGLQHRGRRHRLMDDVEAVRGAVGTGQDVMHVEVGTGGQHRGTGGLEG